MSAVCNVSLQSGGDGGDGAAAAEPAVAAAPASFDAMKARRAAEGTGTQVAGDTVHEAAAGNPDQQRQREVVVY